MKNFSRVFVLLVTLMLLTACVNIPIGDGNKIKIGKDGFTITDSEGEQRKVDLSDEGIEVTDEKGENRFELSEEGMKLTDEDGKDQTFTFDEESEQLVVEGFDDEGGEVGFVMGEDVELPKDLPKDIPLTKDAKVSMATNSNSEVVVGYSTGEAIDEVTALYDGFFNTKNFDENPEIMEQNFEEMYSKNYQGTRADGEITVQIIEFKGENQGIQVNIYMYKNIE